MKYIKKAEDAKKTDVKEAMLGGDKYKGKDNPNVSTKSDDLLSSKSKKYYGKVAGNKPGSHIAKRNIQAGQAAYKPLLNRTAK